MTTLRKICIAAVILLAVGVVVAAMVFLNQSYTDDPFQKATGETKTVHPANDASELDRMDQVSVSLPESDPGEGSLFLPESSEPSEDSSEDPIVVPDIVQLIESIKAGTYKPTIKLVGSDIQETTTYKNPITEPVEVAVFEDSDDPDAPKIEEFVLLIHVSDSDGHPIEKSKVMLEKDVYYTDADGYVRAATKIQNPQLVISAVDRAAYYEELDLTTAETVCDVILANAAHMQSLLNSQDLRPYVTNDDEINRYIEALLKDLTDNSMDTYTKVLKCYEYMINHTYYKSPAHWKRPYQKYYWSCGYQCLCEGYGTCNCYSAAFTLMMRRIGLQCFVVEGYTTSSKGGYTSHEWPVILLGGQYYIFDCQVEDAIITRSGSREIDLIRFGLPQNHEKYQYRKTTLAYEIKEFQDYVDANGKYLND
ncbi:MAG: transglutaminase domain-containing protein [Clostridia bacterium]|nr:transglutaminase domain-containing protein [Clostridia bacterium]